MSGTCGLPRVNPVEEEEELEGGVLGFSCSLLLPAALRTRSFYKRKKKRQNITFTQKQKMTYIL